MGSICQTTPEILDISPIKPKLNIRSGSFILDNFSKQEDINEKYDYIKMLGSGSYGKVRLFKEKDSDLLYAIKTTKKDFLNFHSLYSLKREVDILRSLDHPNIVKYFDTYEDTEYIHIIMEYVPGNNLFNVITSKKYKNFSEKEICHITFNLLKVVLFLQNNNIVHRDIKPENILFGQDDNFDSLKLIDFGLSIQKNAEKEFYRVGSLNYMSPEMVNGNFCPESDIWSIGVILFFLVTGYQPFKGNTKAEVFDKINKGDFNKKILEKSDYSDELKDLIKRMLVIDSKKRIKVNEAIEHPWIKYFENDLFNKNAIIKPEILQSIRNFYKKNQFQKEILFYLAKISKEKDIENLRNAFTMIDVDNSGEIEYEEIPKIFQDQGFQINEEELKRIFDSLDFHSEGKINYSEFLASTLSSIHFFNEEKLWSTFKHFDTNNTGYITYENVFEVLVQSGFTNDFDKINKAFEENGYKEINYTQFKDIIIHSNE